MIIDLIFESEHFIYDIIFNYHYYTFISHLIIIFVKYIFMRYLKLLLLFAEISKKANK